MRCRCDVATRQTYEHVIEKMECDIEKMMTTQERLLDVIQQLLVACRGHNPVMDALVVEVERDLEAYRDW